MMTISMTTVVMVQEEGGGFCETALLLSLNQEDTMVPRQDAQPFIPAIGAVWKMEFKKGR